MKSSQDIYFIITTMEGVPVTKPDWSIMKFTDTKSCRNNAKNYTFKNKIRHHTWWLTKAQYILSEKEYADQWFININTLWRKWD